MGKMSLYGAIGMVLGAVLALCVGLFDATVWFGIGGSIIGLIIGAAKEPSPAKKAEMEKAALEETVKHYRVVLEQLPEKQMNQLCYMLMTLENGLMKEGAEIKDMPSELVKMSYIALPLMRTGKYGTLTPAQCNAVDRALEDFANRVQFILPALHNALIVAENKGLGFGVIGSAADVALHSALDTMQKVGNINTTFREVGQRINTEVILLRTALSCAINTKDNPTSSAVSEKSSDEPETVNEMPEQIRYYFSEDGEMARKKVYEKNLPRSGNLEDDIYEYLNYVGIARLVPDMTDFFGEPVQPIRHSITPLLRDGRVVRIEYNGLPYFYHADFDFWLF